MKKVLIVEDDFMTIDAVVDTFDILKILYNHVDNVADAFQELYDNEYSCLLLDVMLPPGDHFSLEDSNDGRYTGLLFLELLRTDERFSAKVKNMPVALITNWRNEPEVERYANDFGAKVIQKPLRMQDIRSFIDG